MMLNSFTTFSVLPPLMSHFCLLLFLLGNFKKCIHELLFYLRTTEAMFDEPVLQRPSFTYCMIIICARLVSSGHRAYCYLHGHFDEAVMKRNNCLKFTFIAKGG